MIGPLWRLASCSVSLSSHCLTLILAFHLAAILVRRGNDVVFHVTRGLNDPAPRKGTRLSIQTCCHRLTTALRKAYLSPNADINDNFFSLDFIRLYQYETVP